MRERKQRWREDDYKRMKRETRSQRKQTEAQREPLECYMGKMGRSEITLLLITLQQYAVNDVSPHHASEFLYCVTLCRLLVNQAAGELTGQLGL